MATEIILPITGYHDRAVPNRLLRPGGGIDHLAMLLPGLGYTLDMPLFYYSQMGCLDTGIDVLRVEAAYNRDADFAAATNREQLDWVTTDATAAWHAGLAQAMYSAAIIVGKSLGTLAMPALITETRAHDLSLKSVWLTPLLSQSFVFDAIVKCGPTAMVVIGDADPHYDPDLITQLQAAGITAIVVLGANHGLDLSGDVVGSVRVLERVVAAIHEFCLT